MLVVFGASSIAPAFAHSGGTDRYGCHRDNSNGTRHCH
ncbi:YHYH domain-containing protein [Pusillimonas minor]|nr:YHYH domain-containing protein [Pusillimonas minor]